MACHFFSVCVLCVYVCCMYACACMVNISAAKNKPREIVI